jgi:hypothetical protein
MMVLIYLKVANLLLPLRTIQLFHPIPPRLLEIISIHDGQQVPAGELTIEGISSDDEETDCQVYADVNDITPLQKATA